MRRRLQKFLPIVLIALVVQILAPIAACWAAGVAASDPLGSALGSAFICHDTAVGSPAQSDQGGDHRSHNGACSICCIAQAATVVDAPQQMVVTAPYRQPTGFAGGPRRFHRPGARATAIDVNLAAIGRPHVFTT